MRDIKELTPGEMESLQLQQISLKVATPATPTPGIGSTLLGICLELLVRSFVRPVQCPENRQNSAGVWLHVDGKSGKTISNITLISEIKVLLMKKLYYWGTPRKLYT